MQQSPQLARYEGEPFNFQVILEQLRAIKVQADGPAGFTRKDLQQALGIQRARASEILQDLVTFGLVELVGKRPMVAIDGGMRLIPVYRLLAKG